MLSSHHNNNGTVPYIVRHVTDPDALLHKINEAKQCLSFEQKQLTSLKNDLNSIDTEIIKVKQSKIALYLKTSMIGRLQWLRSRLNQRIQILQDQNKIENFIQDLNSTSEFLNNCAKTMTQEANEIIVAKVKAANQEAAASRKLNIYDLEAEKLQQPQQTQKRKRGFSVDDEQQAKQDENIKKKQRVEVMKMKKLNLFENCLNVVPNSENYNIRDNIKSLQEICPLCNIPYNYDYSICKLVCKKCAYTTNFTGSFTSNSVDAENDQSNQQHTHLLDILEPFRPRKWKVIDPQTFEDLKYFERQNRYESNKDRTFAKTQAYLKHLKLTELYEYKFQITMQMNGVMWPIMSQIQEWKIIFLFFMMQLSSERIKNLKFIFDDKRNLRNSFSKYDFALSHIARILLYDEFVPFLKVLKVPHTHIIQTRIIRTICKDLGIDYIPQLH